MRLIVVGFCINIYCIISQSVNSYRSASRRVLFYLFANGRIYEVRREKEGAEEGEDFAQREYVNRTV